jgi:hypothetical protein
MIRSQQTAIVRTTIVLLVVAVGATIGWYYWTTTPRYSIYRLHEAIEAHNAAEAEKYVDIDRIGQSLANELMAKQKAKMEEELRDNPFRGLGYGMMAVMEGPMRDLAKSMLRQSFQKAIEDGETPLSDKSSLWSSFALREMTITGDLSTFKPPRLDSASPEYQQLADDLTFKMVRAPEGHWRVVEIQGLVAWTEGQIGTSRTPPSSNVASANYKEEPTASSPAWDVYEDVNEMDGTKEITIKREADHEISGLIGSVRPSLYVRCKGKRKEVIVHVDTQIQNEYGHYRTAGVRIRFDDGAPIRQRWSESTSGDALFSANPTKLTRQLASSRIFFFEYTPFHRSEQTIRFTLDGLQQELMAAKACGWSLSGKRR